MSDRKPSKGYLQLKLDNASVEKLKKKAVYPNVFCHHVTIKFDIYDDDELVKNLIKNGEIYILATDIYKDKDAQAVKVLMDYDSVALSNEDIRMLRDNGRTKNYHVTISTAEGIPPQYSNELLNNPEAEVDPFNQSLKGTFEFGKFGSGK